MSEQNQTNLNLNALRDQTNATTQQQFLEVKNMISTMQDKLSSSESESAIKKVEEDVYRILSSIESKLENDMTNINQQLQTLLQIEQK